MPERPILTPSGASALIRALEKSYDDPIAYKATLDNVIKSLHLSFDADNPAPPISKEQLREWATYQDTKAKAQLLLHLDRRISRSRPMTDVSENDLPRTILSIDNDARGAIATAGTVTMLSGAGGSGKSAFALCLGGALAAQYERPHPSLIGELFHAPPTNVLLATWEDPAAILRRRFDGLMNIWIREGHINPENVPGILSRVHVMEPTEPIYGVGPRASYQSRPAPIDPWWSSLWTAVARTDSKIVMIDPALAAFGADPSSQPAAVREFVTMLSQTAAGLDAAVLLVSHSTKATRIPKGGNVPVSAFYDPGVVAGSMQWIDSSRGVLSIRHLHERTYVISIVKSNYGPSFRSCAIEAWRSSTGEICGWHRAPEARWTYDPLQREGPADPDDE